MKKIIFVVLLSIAGFFITNFSFAEKYRYGSGTNSTKSSDATTAGCANATASTDLDLNNVRAMIHTGGDMWWDLVGNPKYEVPKGSGKNSLFAGAIWIGGTDVNGQLRGCFLRFRQQGEDYWPGPLINRNGSDKASVTPDVCAKFDKHFVIYKTDVSTYRSYITAKLAHDPDLDANFPGYTIPDIITNWPANGDVADGYDVHLAPFFDADQDGYYDPSKGDYPFYDLDGVLPCGTNLRIERLYGDKTLWWVYNDKGNIHTESKGNPIGMEIRAQGFAFSTNDELNNMTFYNYRIVNRSTYTLQDTYFGVWTDADLGNPNDDYVGCDVSRGLGYVYNGALCDGDGNGKTYGCQPPACGLDFFEGPYMDNDGLDNLSSWSPTGTLSCTDGFGRRNANGDPDLNAPYTDQGISGDNGRQSNFVTNGNINGLNFGDGTIDNERWGMRRFIYFNNAPGAMGDPTLAYQYYYYLRGYWSDGTRMTYGGTGHLSSSINADFMFPDVTDPCGWGTQGIPQPAWSEITCNNTPNDVRFVQSAGPFTLQPGATNDITVGVVWARATSGGPWGSVVAMQTADDKAQRLFENCFKVVDGPDAPELSIIELDKTLIFHIFNNKGSNNYKNAPEDYTEEDPFIVCPTTLPSCDRYYRFQGYQVFQLVDSMASVTDITDPDKARIVFQCDIKDGVGQLINYIYNMQLGASVPTDMVDGADLGIKHSFTIINDEFATGDKRLVNYKTYYFVAIAYAYNNYKTYVPTDPLSLDGQKTPYLAGRKGVSGSIKRYSVIPHNPSPNNNGTILNSSYGDGPQITQIEGYGGAENSLDITQATLDKIMSGFPWKADSIVYQSEAGPFSVKVVDPLNVIGDDFILKFAPDSTPVNFSSKSLTPGFNPYTGVINLGKWVVYKRSDALDSSKWIWANAFVSTTGSENEQLIPAWGISIDITQVPQPGDGRNSITNGFIEASIDFTDISKPWLEFVPDDDECDPTNWIRSGKQSDINNPVCKDYQGFDDNKDFAKISLNPYAGLTGGTWAPYNLVSTDLMNYGSSTAPIRNQKYGIAFTNLHSTIKFSLYRFPSVDIYITSDQSKWSRSPVVEMCEYNEDTVHNKFLPGMSEGNQLKFCLRKHASVDKNGNYATATNASIDPDSANYIGATGMGWFPGYAIDVETGERLNVVYGEDSRFPGENGADMIWNPTVNLYSDLYYATGGTSGDVLFGGKHCIYVIEHSVKDSASNYQEFMPKYDAGKTFHDRIINAVTVQDPNLTSAWKNAVWAAIPMINPALTNYDHSKTYGFIQSDVKIRLRVANPYTVMVNTFAKDSAHVRNRNFPMYSFSTKSLASTTNSLATAKSALDMIRAVPNPYYGYNAYEVSQVDNRVKFINLPQKCTISIYNVGGTLVRQYQKDSDVPYQDWDIKNEYGITVASGVYIIYINAPGIGEKILKWFGALRPIDLNTF